jgi:hypothetical protein
MAASYRCTDRKYHFEYAMIREPPASRTVHWVCVKGHLVDGGNDRADELVQWGKGEGPYCRLREGGGEGEGRYGAAATAAPATVMGQIYGSVPARRRTRARSTCSTHFLRV